MRKSKNRVYRWIAMMLTAALLVGQCQAPVLAKEGTAPVETGVSGENKDGAQEGGSGAADKDAPEDDEEGTDNGGGEGGAGETGSGTEEGGGDTDNGGAGEGGTDNGDDGAGSDHGDSDGSGNGGADDDGEDNPGAGDTGTGDEDENNGGGEGALDKCVCETACTEDAINEDCPVCAADYAACAKNAGEGVKPSEEGCKEDGDEEETVSENNLEADEGIALMVMNDAKALAVGDEFVGDDGLKYRVRDTVVRKVSVVGHKDGTDVRGDLEVPSTITNDGITYKVTEIGGFGGCKWLTGITIPDSVENIGGFRGCTSLTSIELDNVIRIGGWAFNGCSGLTNVKMPKKAEHIGACAFMGCSSLTEITIPDGVTCIDERTFDGCYRLARVTISNKVTEIKYRAFASCSLSGGIVLPDSVTTIGEDAFIECGMTSIKLPSSVKTIKKNTFAYCNNLTRVEISENLTSIDSYAFAVCRSLEELRITVLPDREFRLPGVVIGIEGSFLQCPTERYVFFVDSEGNELTGDALYNAKLVFIRAAKSDYNDDGDDSKWVGWSCKDLPEIKTWKVTINDYVDGEPWENSRKTYYLINKNYSERVDNLDAVEAGTYTVYSTDNDLTKIGEITVKDADVTFTVDYYTVTFYDIDADGNLVEYGGSWSQEVYLKAKSMREPASVPTKKGYTFDKWVTAPGGDEPFEFPLSIMKQTKLYAKWNIAQPHHVTINVRKDDVFCQDHDRTFGLRRYIDSTVDFVTDLDAVEPGSYDVLEVTGQNADGSLNKTVDTGVNVKVVDTDASATVDYYTLTFYDVDDDGNVVRYGDDTPWGQQTVLRMAQYPVMPIAPTKPGYTFEKWVTKPGGNLNFYFNWLYSPAKAYAKWTKDTVPTYTVTISVKKDGNPWSNHGRTFALLGGGGSGFLEVPGQTADSSYTISQVPDGTYRIYDITGVPADALYSRARDTGAEVRVNGADTEVDVTVNGADVEKDVHYYTATFYDGTEAYKAGTPQEPQIILRGKMAAKPEDPQKADWQFAGWKTTDGGSTPYDFDTPVTDITSIFASWVEKTAEQLHITADATAGGTIDPTGDIAVTKGGEQSFTITPNEGYKIKTVTVDGKDVTAGLKDTLARAQAGARYYTFTNVTENHTIHAAFEADSGDKPDDGGDDKPDDGDDKPDDDGDKPGGGGDKPNPGDDKPDGGGDNPAPDGDIPGGETGTAQVTVVSQASSLQDAVAPDSSAGNGGASATGQAAGGKKTPTGGGEPKTGDAAPTEIYATAAMIAGLTYLLLYFMEESRGMTEREKEVFVAAFIRWAKKGGRFRRCCAIAAIFCLLVYYHSIGKRAGRVGFDRECLRQSL